MTLGSGGISWAAPPDQANSPGCLVVLGLRRDARDLRRRGHLRRRSLAHLLLTGLTVSGSNPSVWSKDSSFGVAGGMSSGRLVHVRIGSMTRGESSPGLGWVAGPSGDPKD